MATKRKIKSVDDIFRMHWRCWQFLGMVPKKGAHQTVYKIYSYGLKFFANVLYPMHLVTAIFTGESSYDLFKNLAINITVPVICIKTFIIWWKMDKVRQVDEIIKRLERHVTAEDEVQFYEGSVLPTVMRVLHIFYLFLLTAFLSLEAMVIITGILDEWHLLYSMYFPFDVYASWSTYIAAHLYQFLTFSVIAAEAIFIDSYGAMSLAMLGGHVRLLCLRITKIGKDPSKTLEQNNAEFLVCVQDHKTLIEFHTLIENIITWITFTQIIAFGMNICMIVVYLLFYVEDFASYLFYGSFMLAVSTQMFPACYYGTYFEIEFEKLTYSIFSANWVDQSAAFKQNMRIFAEQTLRKRNTKAGFFFTINLDTFFAACKGAYSLMALVMQMK